jgi:hypothetical protein
LKANGNASARRDIVATNEAIKGFWKRIRDDYGTRMVVFEVKNLRSSVSMNIDRLIPI